jgi:hypothetical protein
MSDGPLWTRMNQQPQRSMETLCRDDIPDRPGVYAIYRDGAAIYVGLAEKQTLRDRIWKNHSGRGAVMTGSAFRRNVAEHLGIATAAQIKNRTYQPTADEVAAVRTFIDGCSISWIPCATARDARNLETSFKDEWKPPLTRR